MNKYVWTLEHRFAHGEIFPILTQRKGGVEICVVTRHGNELLHHLTEDEGLSDDRPGNEGFVFGVRAGLVKGESEGSSPLLFSLLPCCATPWRALTELHLIERGVNLVNGNALVGLIKMNSALTLFSPIPAPHSSPSSCDGCSHGAALTYRMQ